MLQEALIFCSCGWCMTRSMDHGSRFQGSVMEFQMACIRQQGSAVASRKITDSPGYQFWSRHGGLRPVLQGLTLMIWRVTVLRSHQQQQQQQQSVIPLLSISGISKSHQQRHVTKPSNLISQGASSSLLTRSSCTTS